MSSEHEVSCGLVKRSLLLSFELSHFTLLNETIRVSFHFVALASQIACLLVCALRCIHLAMFLFSCHSDACNKLPKKMQSKTAST